MSRFFGSRFFGSRILLNLFALTASSLAFADFGPGPGNDDHGKGGRPGDQAGVARAIDFEELKSRCADPERYDVQRQPQNIKVQCSDQRLNWIAAAPGEVPLNGQRLVTTGIFADKFYVNADRREYSVPLKSGTCLRFREVEEGVTVERPLSCAELLGLKGDIQDFCAQALDTAKGSNPKLVEQKETGRLIDTCGGITQGGNGPRPPKVR